MRGGWYELIPRYWFLTLIPTVAADISGLWMFLKSHCWPIWEQLSPLPPAEALPLFCSDLSYSMAVITVTHLTALPSAGHVFTISLTRKGKATELSIPSSKKEVLGGIKCLLSLTQNRLVKARWFFPSLVVTGLCWWRTKQCRHALSSSSFFEYLICSLNHVVCY